MTLFYWRGYRIRVLPRASHKLFTSLPSMRVRVAIIFPWLHQTQFLMMSNCKQSFDIVDTIKWKRMSENCSLFALETLIVKRLFIFLSILKAKSSVCIRFWRSINWTQNLLTLSIECIQNQTNRRFENQTKIDIFISVVNLIKSRKIDLN